MTACGYRLRWARSGLSFSLQRAHAPSHVVPATLFGREHALKEKILRHPALFSRVQPPGEKCGLVEDEELFGMTEGETEMHPIQMPLAEQRDRTMDAEFIEAIRKGTAVSPNFAEGVRYMEFSEAVAQSIYQGRRISMPPEPKMDSWCRPL